MRGVAFAVFLLSFETVGLTHSVSREAVEVEAKASPVSGVATHYRIASDVANTSICLNGNSTSGPCGGSSPAGITYATTAQNWSQKISSALMAGMPAKVTLSPCPAGIDTTSGGGYQVLISGNGRSEAVKVLSGSCASGLPSGTITFTPFDSYPSGSTIGSASSGIQETINVACGTSPISTLNAQCNVILPPNGPVISSNSNAFNFYVVQGTIFFHSNQSTLSAHGAQIGCTGRGPCLQIGDLLNANHFANNTITGLSFRTPTDYSSVPAYGGVKIASTSVAGGTATISTTTPHGFRPGDIVTILFTDNSAYWGDAVVATVPTNTSFTYSHGGSISSQTTPGVVALSYSAILDNANGSHFIDITYDVNGNNGQFNNFFDFWDDENATIDHFNNNAGNLNRGVNWTGSFIFSGGARNDPAGIGHQLAPVITLRDSTITAVGSNGVTDYNSNGLYIEDTVIQGSGLWQVYSSNATGNYQGAYLKNIYSESSISENPASPVKTPFPGLGIAGLIAGPSTNVARFQIAGTGTEGAFQAGGSGSTSYSYFIVANDTTAGTQTSPMQVLNWLSTGSDSIPVRWPRIATGTDVISYDVIRMATPIGVGAVYPYVGGCTGGSGGACGYVAQGLSQARACSGGLVCTYTDTGSSSTSPYATSPTTHPLLGTYKGNLVFWPGSLVSVDRSISVDVEEGNVVGVGLSANPIQIANQCSSYGASSSGGSTTCSASITTSNNSVPNQTATVMTDGGAMGGGMSVSKGRLNFSTSPWATLQPHHIITLIDSQPGLTQSTVGYRPPASANDVWIGTDVPAGGVGLNAGQLAFGAPVSITNYIGGTGGVAHSNWLERLTSKQKTFEVPVRISDGNSFILGNGSPLSQMKMYRVNNVPAKRVPPQSCVDVVGKAIGLTKSDQTTSVSPPGSLGNLSLNAYPADEDAIILHFCNPSGSEAITPPGAYSFLAVH